MRRIKELLARQGRGHHRRLALTVDLYKPRTHQAQRALDVGHVHRGTAVDDGLESSASRINTDLRLLDVINQALDDGGRGKSCQLPQLPTERKQLGRIDATGQRHDVARARHQMRNGIQTGTVRHRCSVDDGVSGRNRIDIDKIGQPHRHQIALRDHHALGAAGCAAGVEQPGKVVGRALGNSNGKRIGNRRQQGIARGGLDVDLPLQTGQRIRRQIVADKTPARLCVVHNPLGLARMQLGVDR